MLNNPFKSDYFNSSSHTTSDKSLHYNPSVNHIPIKYYLKSTIDSDLYLPNDFYLKASDQIDYDLDFLEISKGRSHDSLLQIPIETLLEEITQQNFEKAQILMEPPIIKTEHFVQKDLWTTKYMPKRFDELLSDEKINREVLCWLKSWDSVVFPDRKKPVRPIFMSPVKKNLMPIFISPKKNFMPTIPGGEPQPHLPTPFNKKPNNFINFDLDDPTSINHLQNNVILLAGPPGTGKTTLARIVAFICGYRPIEINASDDRTAEKLIEKIESACQSHSLNVSEKENKPSLIILDEVDGTADYEGKVSGLFEKLLFLIF